VELENDLTEREKALVLKEKFLQELEQNMDELHEKVKLHYETISQNQEADEKAKKGQDAQENINTVETMKEEKKFIGKDTPLSWRSAGSDDDAIAESNIV